MDNSPGHNIQQYNLRCKVTKEGFFYIEVREDMCKLPQARLLIQKPLEEDLKLMDTDKASQRLASKKHDTRPISFSLMVDDVGVKYAKQERKIQTTSLVSSRRTMKFQLTRMALSAAASPWIGTATTRTSKCTYPCLDRLKRHSKYSSMKTPRSLRISLTNM